MKIISEPLTRTGLTLAAAALLGYGCARSGSGNLPKPKAVDLYVAAVDAYHAGDTQQAKARLEQATRANPELRMAHSMLGDIYRAEGNYTQARREYEATVRLDPYTSSNHYRLGLTYHFLDMFNEAIASYLRAMDLKPNDWQSNMNLGLTYLALNQLDDAVKYTDMATRIDTRQPEAWTNLGVVHDARAEYPKAEQCYRKALELDSDHSTTMLNLGSNLLAQKKTSEAIAVLEQAATEKPTPLVLTRLGEALSEARRLDDAVARFDDAIRLDPRYIPALNAKGATLIRIYQERDLELNDKSRLAALEAWARSLAIRPGQPGIQTLVKKWTEPKLFEK